MEKTIQQMQYMVSRMADRQLPVELIDRWVKIINDLVRWNNEQEAYNIMQEAEIYKQCQYTVLLEAIIIHHGIDLKKFLFYDPESVIDLAETSLRESRWQIPDKILRVMRRQPDILERLIPTNTLTNANTDI